LSPPTFGIIVPAGLVGGSLWETLANFARLQRMDRVVFSAYNPGAMEKMLVSFPTLRGIPITPAPLGLVQAPLLMKVFFEPSAHPVFSFRVFRRQISKEA